VQTRSEIHFWHIPKTAGTTVAGLIRRAYAPDECIPAHTARDIVAMPRQKIAQFRCYTGHFFSLLDPLVGRSIPTVTILRDPVQQTLSLLSHCQRHVSGAGWVVPLYARALAFAWEKHPAARARIEKSWCPVLMNNFQTRVLGSNVRFPNSLRRDFYGLTYPFMEPNFCHAEADMDELYARAVQRLRGMAVVGTVERLPETIGRICSLLGVSKPDVIPAENISSRHRKVSVDFLDLIKKQNVYDYRLHQLASGLLDG